MKRRTWLERVGAGLAGLGMTGGLASLLPVGMPARAGESAASAVAPREIKDFTLPHVRGGKAFELGKARGRWVVLHFLLRTECPICLRHTRTYLQRAKELKDVEQVFIKPDSPEEIERWARDMPKDAPIYRDADAALATRLGVPDGYAFHGLTVHYPAPILIDPDGREVFRHVGRNNGDRFGFDELARKVRVVSGER